MALLAVLVVGVWGAFAVFAAPPGPTVSSFTLAGTSPTKAASVSWTLVFSTTVTGVQASNFTLVPSSGVTGTSITLVSGGGTTWTVSASTGSGSGTLGLNLASAGSIKDSSNRALQGVPYTGPVYTVDKTAPTAAISFPASGGSYNAAGYTAGCSPAGICGTAADSTGAASVRVSIKNPAGNYWNGTVFSGSTEAFNTVSGTTSWKYGLALPPDGAYTVHVQTTDTLGNTQATGVYAASSVFTTDTQAPPAPAISSGPAAGSFVSSTSASFGFTDGEAGVSFLCKLDGNAFAACTSPQAYSSLTEGSHTFQVEAKDAAGNVSGATARQWTVDTVAPAAPTFTSKPPIVTNSTSANFTFTGEAGAAFLCKLDGAGFAACSSPQNLTVSVAQHTFQVEAVDQAGNVGPAVSWTWTVDQTAPTVTVTFPANNGFYNAAGWNADCGGGGGAICGTASDSSGVASGAVSIKRVSTGNYWNGSSFGSASEVYNAAALTAINATSYSSRYPLALPPDGQYVVHAKATDSAGNSSAPVTVTFTIDTVPPPQPGITSAPANPISSHDATFQFSDTEAGVSYLCKLDTGAYTACTSPKSYGSLADGSHTFSVEAVDAAGNVSSPSSYTWVVDTTGPPKPTIVGPNNNNPSTSATFTITDSEANVTYKCSLDGSPYTACTSPKTYTLLTSGAHVFDAEPIDQLGNIGPFNEWKWTINGSSGAGQPFTISNPTLPLLYPGGATDYLNLSLYNPNSVTIYITSLTVSLSVTPSPSASGPNPCSASLDFSLAQYSGGYPIVLPPGTKTLSQLGYTQPQWPSIKMFDRPLSQNACKNATLNFTYGGNAQS